VPKAIPYNRYKVLVIDSFNSFRLSLGNMLSSIGFTRIDMAGNAREALKLVKEKSFDIVLSEYNLGEGQTNGQQLLEELRATRLLRESAIFLMVTSETSQVMVMGALECPPDSYLAKPLTQALLKKRLDSHLIRQAKLAPIYDAAARGNNAQVVKICQDQLAQGTRYTSLIQRKLAEHYFHMRQLHNSEAICLKALETHTFEWAQLLLAEVLLARQEWRQAEALLTRIIDNNPYCMGAYDKLALLLSKTGRFKEAQLKLQDAVAISPRSVKRQTQLAKILEYNNDIIAAIGAYRTSLALAHNSIHETPEVYLQLATCLADAAFEDGSEKGKRLAQESMDILKKFYRKFKQVKHIKLLKALVECRIHQGRKNTKAARNAMNEAEALYTATGEEVPRRVDFELGRTFFALGETDKAEEILLKLLRRCKPQTAFFYQIIALLDNPVSFKARALSEQLYNEGMNHFNEEKFSEAIEKFNEAVTTSPRKPKINLHLLQAHLLLGGENTPTVEMIAECKKCLERVRHLGEYHPEFEQYTTLKQQVEGL
jgi:DNA-binding response OmpR family regulator